MRDARWRDGEPLSFWDAPEKYRRAFAVDGRVYALSFGEGLCVLAPDDSLRLVPDGERFADLLLTVMLPSAPDGWPPVIRMRIVKSRPRRVRR